MIFQILKIPSSTTSSFFNKTGIRIRYSSYPSFTSTFLIDEKKLINLIFLKAKLHSSQFSEVTKISFDMYYKFMRPWTLVFVILLILIIFISGSIALSNFQL